MPLHSNGEAALVTLAMLAAGLGTRFGGPKQFTPVGPNGECLVHYAIYDATQAGFNDFVLITRPELLVHIEEYVRPLLPPEFPIKTVFQETGADGKPLGTAHAIWCCREAIREPFGVVNGDDYYGQNSYGLLAQHLRRIVQNGSQIVAIPFPVEETLSTEGGVNRGFCQSVVPGFYSEMIETYGVQREVDGVIRGKDKNGAVIEFPEGTPVSMNMFGFVPAVYSQIEEFRRNWVLEHAGREAGLPDFINAAIGKGAISVVGEMTDDRWIGMTFPADKKEVTSRLTELHNTGRYPKSLW